MRGYPGSGKSTEAEKIEKEKDAVICSADDFFIKDGKYTYDVENLGIAYSDCFDKFEAAINKGANVIIDNTNLRVANFSKYIDDLIRHNASSDYNYSVEIVQVQKNDIKKAIQLRSNSKDGKNVPIEQMLLMKNAYDCSVSNILKLDYADQITIKLRTIK